MNCEDGLLRQTWTCNEWNRRENRAKEAYHGRGHNFELIALNLFNFIFIFVRLIIWQLILIICCCRKIFATLKIRKFSSKAAMLAKGLASASTQIQRIVYFLIRQVNICVCVCVTRGRNCLHNAIWDRSIPLRSNNLSSRSTDSLTPSPSLCLFCVVCSLFS